MTWKPPAGYDLQNAFVDALRGYLGLRPLYAAEAPGAPPPVYTFPGEGRIEVSGGFQRTIARRPP